MSKKYIKQGGLKSTNENNEMKIIVALVRTLQLQTKNSAALKGCQIRIEGLISLIRLMCCVDCISSHLSVCQPGAPCETCQDRPPAAHHHEEEQAD